MQSLLIASPSPIPSSTLATVVWTMDRKVSAHIDNGLAPPPYVTLTAAGVAALSLLQLRHPQFQGLINTDSSRQPLPHSIIPSGAHDDYPPVTPSTPPLGPIYSFGFLPSIGMSTCICAITLSGHCALLPVNASPSPCDVLDCGLTRRHACWNTCALT